MIQMTCGREMSSSRRSMGNFSVAYARAMVGVRAAVKVRAARKVLYMAFHSGGQGAWAMEVGVGDKGSRRVEYPC